jgi:hypothetical protein
MRGHQLSLLLVAFSSLFTHAASAEIPNPGHVTGTSDINVQDVQCMALIALAEGFSEPPVCMEVPKEYADLSCDGQVTVQDVLLCASIALGLPLSIAIDPDGDNQTNACDSDDDGDGSPDTCETNAGTDPYDAEVVGSTSCPCLTGGCSGPSSCGITAANDGSTCDDANACTEGDVCTAGDCTGITTACDDANVCTDDLCDTALGCTATFNTQTVQRERNRQ